VISAASGPDALQKIGQQSCDLVVTDYKMAPMNGIQLIARLRELNFRNPIILLTGFADNLGLDTENTGADVVIQKSSNEITTLVRHTNRLLQVPKKPVRSAPTTRKNAGSQKLSS